jgi:DNA repair protein RadA/Sms
VRFGAAGTGNRDLNVAKAKTIYTCSECGGQSPKWQGQCPHCEQWNTLIEGIAEVAVAKGVNRFSAVGGTGKVLKLGDVEARDEARLATGIGEFDRVLGGGLVPGGVVLIGGDPGIGKSTLLLQALAQIGRRRKSLYVSGEESAEQIALRAKRLALDAGDLRLLAEIQLEKIQATLTAEKPDLVVIDSIQTVYSEALTSAPGSVAQVRECAAQLTRFAKHSGATVIFVGHVTKEGAIAGPRVLEHIVDTVLYFEGDTHSSFRLVRAFKNRFGAVNELGVFAMTEKGLKGVSNPSALFLSQHGQDVAGSCVLVTQEGTRPLLVEIQALVDEAHAPNPRRLSVGLEQNRLALLLAVLHRHAGIACFDQDVFVNAVGGVRITEPAADLAVLLAVVSSLRGRPIEGKTVAFGEVGLAGEVRPAPRGQERLKEAAKLGFTRAIIPKANAPKHSIAGIEIVAVDRIEQAVIAVR